jgi:hypothetical protein
MKTTCKCCGQKIRKLNPHRMCKQKVLVLEILAKANDWVVAQHGHGIVVGGHPVRAPYRAEAHASRLVWFGLAEHGAPRSGRYRITQAGIDFLQGKHVVPKTIWCKDGVVVDSDPSLVAIGSVKNVVLDKDYWDNYGSIQRELTIHDLI